MVVAGLRSIGPWTVQTRAFRASGWCLNQVDFKLADIGEGIAEVEVMQWFVAPGDKIAEFEPVCEVQSDKATVEITSRYDGTVHSLNWKVGDMAKVGSTLLKITVDDAQQVAPSTTDLPEEEATSSASSEQKAPMSKAGSDPERSRRLMGTQGSFSIDPILTPVSNKVKQPRQPAPPLFNPSIEPAGAPDADARDGKHLTTPAVRRLIKDHGLNINDIVPSGKGGRLLKADVLAHIAERSQQPPAQTNTEALEGIAADVSDGTTQKTRPVARLEQDLEVPLQGIQKMMAKSMTKALEIPHFNLMEEYDMTAAVEFRKQLQESSGAEGVKISFMPLILKAVSLALFDFPQLNAHVNQDVSGTIQRVDHNIGVAMDTPRGLLVPVIHNVQDKSMVEIAQALVELQDKGARNKLGEAELQGGTISLSNIGSIGGTYASPVLLVPQVAIGAIGRIRKVPRFDEEGNVQATSVINISWAADHRVIDGATMARFSNRLKHFLENPVNFIAAAR